MWSKLADELIDHRKIFVAGDMIGRDGPAIAIGTFVIGLLWTNKHLTDGHLPAEVVKHWPHLRHPLAVAEALVTAGLWEKSNGGFLVHDFHDHNFKAGDVQEYRQRVSKVRSKAGRKGGLKSAAVRKQNGKQK